MLVGLVLSVAVVLPLTALLRPEQVIRDNAMSTATDDRPANVVAVRALAVLAPLALLAVLLLVGADAGSVRQVVGVLVAVVAVGLAWVVRTGQRTSRPERASDG